MKKGIILTNFDEAVKICEQTFNECSSDSSFVKEWNEVKTSRNFEMLSTFLTTHDIDNKVFNLKE